MPTEWVANSNTASLMIDLHELAASLSRGGADGSEAESCAPSECEMFG